MIGQYRQIYHWTSSHPSRVRPVGSFNQMLLHLYHQASNHYSMSNLSTRKTDWIHCSKFPKEVMKVWSYLAPLIAKMIQRVFISNAGKRSQWLTLLTIHGRSIGIVREWHIERMFRSIRWMIKPVCRNQWARAMRQFHQRRKRAVRERTCLTGWEIDRWFSLVLCKYAAGGNCK